MPTKPAFAEVSQSLIDAAIDPTLWTTAMDTVARYGNAMGAILLPLKGRSPGTLFSQSLGEAQEIYFAAGWYLQDQRERGIPFLRTKGTFVDQDFSSSHEMAHSDYYRFLAQFKIQWSCGVGFSNADDEWCLVLERGEEQGFYSRQEERDFGRLQADLHRAALLARQLGDAAGSGIVDAFAAIGCASFLIDDLGRVHRHNLPAERLIGDGIDLHRGFIRCGDPVANTQLQGLLGELLNWRSDATELALKSVVIPRPLRRPLVVQGMVLRGLAAAAFSPARVLLFVIDSEQKVPSVPIEELQRSFGLTPTEGLLLAALEKDVPLKQAAETLGIAMETARTHLKRLFLKTRTNRQSDLLGLVRRFGKRLR